MYIHIIDCYAATSGETKRKEEDEEEEERQRQGGERE